MTTSRSSHDTLVFDVGTTIIGIMSVRTEIYTPYYGDDRRKGALRLFRAREIVTYAGKRYDVREIRKILSLAEDHPVPKRGIHIDMRSICWSDRIMGSDLRSTYSQHFDQTPDFPDAASDYELSNRVDVYQTWKLWECFRKGTLKVKYGLE